VESDFKRVVALSTLSQLGLIGFRLSLGIYLFCFYHLVLHALFKSLLFLGVGVIIHNNRGSQDGRLYGNFIFSSPLLGVSLIISLIRLRGIPFICGFYSKDLIIEYSLYSTLGVLFLFISYFSLLLTLCYRMRFLYRVSFRSLKMIDVVTSIKWALPIVFLGLICFFMGC